MKWISGIAAVLGALALGLTACGGHDNSPAAAGGQRTSVPPGTSAPAPASATPAPTAPQTPAAASSAPAFSSTLDFSSTPAVSPNSALGPASQTPCREFKNMGTDDEKALMDKVLAENPGSKLDGSPNVALGTAKLVCLMSSQADTPVAVAIGIAER
jgi:hypothetical protein